MDKMKKYPKYKDSGIEWIGDIPEHWNVMPFKRLFKILYRYPTYYNIDYVNSGIPEIRGEALNNGGTISNLKDQRYIAEATNALYPLTILKKNDIVMSVRGTMGKVGSITPLQKSTIVRFKKIYIYFGCNFAALGIRVSLLVIYYFG